MSDEEEDVIREITLVVDSRWYEAIRNLTEDVYDGETCEWIRVERV